MGTSQDPRSNPGSDHQRQDEGHQSRSPFRRCRPHQHLGHWSAQAPPPLTLLWPARCPYDLWIWTVSPSEKRSRGPCQLWDAQTQRAGDGPPRGSRAACHAAVSGHGPPPSVYRTRTPDLTKSISLSLHLDMIDQNRALRFLGLPW